MSDYDVIVIGGGEAGISAALRATQLGAKVCMINREAELGGGCVRTGTLPSKTLSNAAHFLENLKKGKRYGIPVVENARADYKTILDSRHKTTMCELGVLATLLRKNAIASMTGTAAFKGPHTVEVRLPDGTTTVLDAPKTIIATGSRPMALPNLPFDGKVVLSADELTAMDAVPGRLLIVGAGVIGCEMAFIFRSLGSEVVVVEKADRALLGQDHDVAALITREFKKRGIRLVLKTGLERVEREPPLKGRSGPSSRAARRSKPIGSSSASAAARTRTISASPRPASRPARGESFRSTTGCRHPSRASTPPAMSWPASCCRRWPSSRPASPPRMPWASTSRWTIPAPPGAFTPIRKSARSA